jgi:hypothetical protein
MAIFTGCEKKLKKIKKKLNASFSESISVYAASDARGQYLEEIKYRKQNFYLGEIENGKKIN